MLQKTERKIVSKLLKVCKSELQFYGGEIFVDQIQAIISQFDTFKTETIYQYDTSNFD